MQLRFVNLSQQLDIEIPKRVKCTDDTLLRMPVGVKIRPPFGKHALNAIRRKTVYNGHSTKNKAGQAELLFNEDSRFIVLDFDVGSAHFSALEGLLRNLLKRVSGHIIYSARGCPKLVVEKQFINQRVEELIAYINKLLSELDSPFTLDKAGLKRTFVTPEALDSFLNWTSTLGLLPFASDLMQVVTKGYFLTPDIERRVKAEKTVVSKLRIILPFLRRFFFIRRPDQEFFFSQSKLAATIGCNQSSIARALKLLEAEGFVETTDGRYTYGGRDNTCKRSELAEIINIKNDKRIESEAAHQKFIAQPGNNNRRLVSFILRQLAAGRSSEEIEIYLRGVEGLVLDLNWFECCVRWALRKLKLA